MTARLYDISRDRPAAELREWSDSDHRLGTLLEEERENWEAGQVAGKCAKVILLVGGCWLLVVGVLLWK